MPAKRAPALSAVSSPATNPDEQAPTPRRAPDPLFNQSLEKGLDVLRAFSAAHRTLTLAELAQLTGMTKGSAQRTVHTLQVLGYVGKHPQTRRFQLLPKVIEIGFNYLAAHPIIRAAHPYLAQLATASGETASLTEPVGLEMVYVAQLQTTQFIPVLTPVGMRIPMYCTSSGRAYLSALPDAEVRALLTAAPRPARTPATLTDVDVIVERIAACRQMGFATNCEELFLGDMGVAAPIRNSRGQPVAAVHLSPPTSRWTMEEAQRKLAPMVLECARAIEGTTP
ncbi:IclR family transcriptional regulator [Paracidovorax wautersii]|uniref:IclR family pca regulon transcriptional regulator n=1 Tax=Paracidovorax wautersii TaxID=1177982 RepID=A0ABU1I8Y9_9BURK|nr:IclR family transcriptional regulator [Paracidovorax wautersii]MDR6213691.1 IclR family pca regulon transcriptional regulator [Paracidovorax wautersii]